MTFATLAAGTYKFTITTNNNFANGTGLAQGFRFDSQAAIPLAPWTQPSNRGNMGSHYSEHLSGKDSAYTAVPEPETYVMLLAGLGILGAVTRHRNRKNSVAAYSLRFFFARPLPAAVI